MSNLAGQLLSDVITLAVAEENQYKPQILAAAKAGGVTAENAVNAFIDSLHVGGALALIAPALKGAVKTAVDNAIAKGIAEDDIIFDALVAAEQNLAKRLA